MTGDCREVMAGMADGSVDAIVTDPPYELGFMGKSWDASGIAYDLDVWRQALRVLKPGGHLLAFSGSRTYHRMVCAIEDAGFEIRDQIMWLYGSGFPKSHDVSKAIDREAGAERRVVGEKPQTGAKFKLTQNLIDNGGFNDPDRVSYNITAPATPEAEQWSGWGTALKPAHEPIVVARKPFKGTVAANVLAHGTGALNVDGCRVGTEGGCKGDGSSGPSSGILGNGLNEDWSPPIAGLGRWPANVIHDGSDEITSGLGEAARFFYCAKASKRDREEGLDGFEERRVFGDGGASLDGISNTRGPRANHHPTVKPTDLMRYLCRLVVAPGGIVLDPFTGSGSTGKAAVLEGFQFIGIELSEEYSAIAMARIQNAINSKSI
jgi:site-specific DNA-methyltransferase (adenine-specific)